MLPRGCRPLETLLDRGDGAPVCSFFLARDESVGVSSEWSPLLLPRLLDKSLLRLLDKSLLRLHDKSLLRLLEKSLLRLHDRSLLLLHDSSLLLNNSQVELGCSVLAGCSSLARRDLSARICQIQQSATDQAAHVQYSVPGLDSARGTVGDFEGGVRCS